MSDSVSMLKAALHKQLARERERLVEMEPIASGLGNVDKDLLQFAIDTFGSESEAADWLLSRPFIMNGRCPLELLQTEAGRERVKHSLGCIRFGHPT